LTELERRVEEKESALVGHKSAFEKEKADIMQQLEKKFKN
jgi:hypothetical protein